MGGLAESLAQFEGGGWIRRAGVQVGGIAVLGREDSVAVELGDRHGFGVRGLFSEGVSGLIAGASPQTVCPRVAAGSGTGAGKFIRRLHSVHR